MGPRLNPAGTAAYGSAFAPGDGVCPVHHGDAGPDRGPPGGSVGILHHNSRVYQAGQFSVWTSPLQGTDLPAAPVEDLPGRRRGWHHAHTSPLSKHQGFSGLSRSPSCPKVVPRKACWEQAIGFEITTSGGASV